MKSVFLAFPFGESKKTFERNFQMTYSQNFHEFKPLLIIVFPIDNFCRKC